MEEILFLVEQELSHSGYKDMVGAGVVLTGGAALIEGCQELAEQIFNLPTRVGYPLHVSGLKDVVDSPKYATAVGLLRYGAEKESRGQRKFAPSGGGGDAGLFKKIVKKMKEWGSDIT
jgi:cell division protein FtsA